jgi:hypothetical protein
MLGHVTERYLACQALATHEARDCNRVTVGCMFHLMRKTSSTPHEGQLIHAALQQAGYTITDLARAAGVAWPSAQKYVLAETLGKAAWATCRAGLEKLSINWRAIRVDGVVSAESMPIEDLMPLFDELPREVLPTLLRILRAHPTARERFADALEGAVRMIGSTK